MLRISMKPGEYFTVGGSTVVQFDRLRGDRAHLIINAPREVPILRGAVLEREGGKRPDCVVDTPERFIRQLPWDHDKKAALQELKEALEQMGESPEVHTLREKLDRIFPAWKDD
ncbi:MAG: carbon storage regulator [Oscillibacter sp.]|nr:carbon storage regulator [Oscillibacter sp.]